MWEEGREGRHQQRSGGVADPDGSIVVSVNQGGSGQQTLARSPDPTATTLCYHRAPSGTVAFLLALPDPFLVLSWSCCDYLSLVAL